MVLFPGKTGKMYTLRRSQLLPVSLDEAWAFFSDPNNLPEITPPEMDFRIGEGASERMYAGMIISYRLRPIGHFWSRWVTEITHVDAPHFFVDEQRIGPYRFWHHKHYFSQVADGVQVVDVVHYEVPFGLFGRLIHNLFIAKRLHRIFDYRAKALSDRYANQASHVR
jgi:ligand-binding SRPBCC domain-containing protein